MNKKQQLVIYPSRGIECVFSLMVPETGEVLATHFCSGDCYAYGDLYGSRIDRKEALRERFGEVEVLFLDQTNISEKTIEQRSFDFYYESNDSTERGRYYGYPECCIRSFAKNVRDNENETKLDFAQSLVHKNLGFIPCEECSQQVLIGEKTLADLIINRQCPTTFPIDNNDTILKK